MSLLLLLRSHGSSGLSVVSLIVRFTDETYTAPATSHVAQAFSSTMTTTKIGRVRERSTGMYTALLKDENGLAVTDLTTLSLTLYDVASQATINDRDAQDVLNDHDVTLVNGALTWTIQQDDHVVVGTTLRLERHRAVFDYTWNGGTKRDWHAIEFLVEEEPMVS